MRPGRKDTGGEGRSAGRSFHTNGGSRRDEESRSCASARCAGGGCILNSGSRR